MAERVFVDVSVLDLLDAHVLGDGPVPPAHEWAVDDLHFMLERFRKQLAFAVSAPLQDRHQATLVQLEDRYQIPFSPVLTAEETPGDSLVAPLIAAGAPPAQASLLAACAREKIRLFLQAESPADGFRDRVLRVCDVYIVDPMNCLSHLHASLMGRTQDQPS